MLMKLRVGRAEFEGTPEELSVIARELGLHDAAGAELRDRPVNIAPMAPLVRVPANGRITPKLVEDIPEETFEKLVRADFGLGPYRAGSILFGRPVRSVGQDQEVWWAIYSRIGKTRRRLNIEDQHRRGNAAIIAALGDTPLPATAGGPTSTQDGFA